MIQWMNETTSYFAPSFETAVIRLIPIVIFGFIATILTRKAAASIRHQVWLAVVCLAIVLPFVSYSLPSLAILPNLNFSEQTQSNSSETEFAIKVNEKTLSAEVDLPTRHPAMVIPASSNPSMNEPATLNPATVSTSVDAVSGITTSLSLLSWVSIVWMFVAVCYFVLPVWSQFKLNQRFHSSAMPDDRSSDILDAIRLQLVIRRNVTLRISPDEIMPMTWGVLRPIVLLPASSVSWTADRLSMVLLHELAHVKRFDCLIQWVTTLAKAMYWFHPGIWIADRRLSVEREQACDDAVVNAGYSGSDYATQLLDISTGYRRNVLALCAGIAMSRSARLHGRLQAILDSSVPRTAASMRVSVLTGFLAIIIGGFIAIAGPASAQELGVPIVNQDSNSSFETGKTPQNIAKTNEFADRSGVVLFRLPDGTQIELLGIGDDPADVDKTRWWRVDGSSVADDESMFHGFDGIHNPRTGGIAFKQFAVRVTGGQDPRAAERTRIFTVAEDDLGGIRWRSEFQQAPNAQDRSTKGFLASYATTQETATLSFAVALHHDVRTWRISSFNRKSASTVVQYEPEERTVISGPIAGDAETLVLPVAHTFTQHDVRIYAIKPNGKRVEASSINDTGSDGFRHAIASFNGLKLEEVQNFELEIRPLIRFEIRNASLRPGRLTRPKLFGPWTPAKGEGPFEGGMQYTDSAKKKAFELKNRTERTAQTQRRLESMISSAPENLTVKQRQAIEQIARYECEVVFDTDDEGKILLNIDMTIEPGDDDQAIQSLSAFDQIEHIQLSGEGLTDLHFRGLSKLKKLRGLTVFKAPNVTGFFASSLSHFKNLEYVRITASEFDDTDLEQLTILKMLKYLELDGTSITDNGLKHLAEFPLLEHVDLSGTDLTGAGFEVLRDHPSLTHLMLDDTELTDAAIAKLAGAPNLVAVHIQRTYEVTAEAVLQLKSCPKLIGLGLNDWHVSDAVLEMIASKRELKYLWLDGAGITDATLAQLSKSDLNDLIINGARITNDGVRHLAKMTNLSRLAFNDCRIGDGALLALHQLDNLELLDIEGTDVTDKGLLHLSELASLNYVNATRTPVTQAGAESLKTVRPKVTIAYDRTFR